MTDGTMKDAAGALDRLRRVNLQDYGMVIALIATILYFQWQTDGVLLTPLNITNIVLQNSYIVIMALGMLLVIVCFHIDLSVGSVAAFIGAIAGTLLLDYDWPWPLAVALCLLIGAVIGGWHGYWIAYQGIPSFIVTLASMLLFRGLTLVVIGANGTIGPMPGSFNRLAAGFIGDPFGGEDRHVLTVVLGVALAGVILATNFRARQNLISYGAEAAPFSLFLVRSAVLAGVVVWMSWSMAGFQGFPIAFILVASLVAIYSVVTTRTVIGRRIYATGGNAEAARLAGVRPRRMVLLTFANMGMLAALGGLVFTARLNSATPKAGEGLELDVIAAVFIGGASAAGGRGKVAGTVAGAFLIGILNNGMSIMGVDIGWQRVIKGLVLLVAVWFDVFNKRRVTAAG